MPVQVQPHHLAPDQDLLNDRLFCLDRESVNCIHARLNVIEHAARVVAFVDLHTYGTAAFNRYGGHFLDAVDILDALLNALDDLGLNLNRRGSPEGHRHSDGVERKLRKQLYLDRQ